MDFNIIHSIISITPERPWGLNIANYLFLTGISAANFIFASLYFIFKQKNFKNIAFLALIIAFIFLMVAPLNLIDDLTQPGRIVNVFLYGWENFFTSPMKWGVLLLIFFFFTIFLELYLSYQVVFKQKLKYQKSLFYCSILGFILALGIEFYTAYLIAILTSFIFLHTSIMPILFLISALVSGSGMLILIAGFYIKFFTKEKLDSSLFTTLSKFLACFALLDLIIRIFWFSFLLVFNTEDKFIAQIFFQKEGFFIIFVDMGLCLLLPLIIGFSRLNQKLPFIFLAGCLGVLGSLLFRYTLVIKGQSFPKTTPSFLEYHIDFSNLIGIICNYGLLIALFCLVLAFFNKNILIKGN
ncbi:NrfD/PsrC family molybdoenzyme membrane anchor subunit [Campylobacter estrildidarum]|uniref:Polysulfide reductase NrfD n=1 Tax=Campylobacter estrildidarum TaxID=2510189 RepID=A0A4U7BM98_9BACT|nr:NrfD/PsrC family molybdoenzyme membrane anchor subunit [Campylobacter estrildidarum]TKX30006.1 polysulfide reductase NrfD [Campylobacter estrildidarum]